MHKPTSDWSHTPAVHCDHKYTLVSQQQVEIQSTLELLFQEILIFLFIIHLIRWCVTKILMLNYKSPRGIVREIKFLENLQLQIGIIKLKSVL